MSAQPDRAALSRFHEELSAHDLAPLWEVMRALAPREPKSKASPILWPYGLIRKLVLKSGGLITAEQAERRVLVLENPGLKGTSRITPSLYAGVQLILPGETAPSHRHTAAAIRMILEGEGGHTAVDGEKIMMKRGDFIITPSGTFHDHGNDGDGPVIWLDGLDVPIINMFEAAFSEDYPDKRQPVTRPPGDAWARYASGLLPVGFKSGTASPLFYYPYDRTREALEQMRKRDEWDAAEGLKLRYNDPTTGTYPVRTMGTFMQLLPKGFRGAPIRSTDGTLFAVLEGRGSVEVEDRTLAFGPGDLFVVPSWHWRSFTATEDTVLFSLSDRPIQEWLGILREERQPI